LRCIVSVCDRPCLFFAVHFLQTKACDRKPVSRTLMGSPAMHFIFPFACCVKGYFLPWSLRILALMHHQNHRWHRTGLILYHASCPKWGLLVSEKHTKLLAGGLTLSRHHYGLTDSL
jgi:hypothetical protein